MDRMFEFGDSFFIGENQLGKEGWGYCGLVFMEYWECCGRGEGLALDGVGLDEGLGLLKELGYLGFLGRSRLGSLFKLLSFTLPILL